MFLRVSVLHMQGMTPIAKIEIAIPIPILLRNWDRDPDPDLNLKRYLRSDLDPSSDKAKLPITVMLFCHIFKNRNHRHAGRMFHVLPKEVPGLFKLYYRPIPFEKWLTILVSHLYQVREERKGRESALVMWRKKSGREDSDPNGIGL